jgi:tol-pal system protein YbgF
MTGNRGAIALVAAGTLILGCCLARPGMAQDSGMPPADVGTPGAPDQYGAPDQSGAQDTGAPPEGSDAASLLLRVERLEDQIRQMNGQIQQMQFDNRKLADQLRKFQEDVDFRFQEGGHKGLPKHEDSGALTAPAPPLASTPMGTTPMGEATQSAAVPATPSEPARGHDDAFDPRTDPNAPGAPRTLGTTPPSAPLPPDTASADSDAPINLPSSGYSAAPAASAPAVSQSGAPAGAVTTPSGTMLASTEVNSPKEEFDVALGYFRQKDYDNAQKSLSAFLEKNPKTHWTSDALYYLGETYYERGRQREAAEQYLKISTDYASSPVAPEAMLRLGESLQALGAKEQACATFGEVPRKYPNASAAVKAGAEREAKRAQC